MSVVRPVVLGFVSLILLGAASACSSARGEQPTIVTGSVVDDQTGHRLPCRLYVRSDQGHWHFAQSQGDGPAVIYDKYRSATESVEKHTCLDASGFRLSLTPGRYQLIVEHGKEYMPVKRTIRVGDDPVAVEIRLTRMIDMAKQGWYSGDTHVHRKLSELPTLIRAEDLNVALPLSYWVTRDQTLPDSGQEPVAEGLQRVDPHRVIYPINTEYEIFRIGKRQHTQGAVFVLNHTAPLGRPAPPSRPIAIEARRQGAILDLDKHSWNWSLMVVPVMGVDLFELSNNHHWRTNFGFPAWTVENAPKDWPEIEMGPDGFTEQGWTEFGFQTYYALLNCGFRMRVSAGTASGVHPVPLGFGRVYVHTGKTFTYDAWIENLNRGQSFVTQGPLMIVRFNDQLPGHHFKPKSAESAMRIQGQIISARPLREVEVIVNGRVAESFAPKRSGDRGRGFRVDIDREVSLNGSAWIALRCFEQLPGGRSAFAHSNPVFVDVPGKPIRPRRRSVQYFIRRMEEEIQRNTGVLPEESVAEFREAKQIYEDLLSKATD